MSEDPRRALREKLFGDPNIVSGAVGQPETFLTIEQFKEQFGTFITRTPQTSQITSSFNIPQISTIQGIGIGGLIAIGIIIFLLTRKK